MRNSKYLCYSAWLLPVVLLLASCATTSLDRTPPVQNYPAKSIAYRTDLGPGEYSLKVMTLNVAHGRGTAFHQMLQDSDTTVKNLDTISTLLNAVAPDVVAFQEIDGPSFWSGNFDHVEYLARSNLFTQSVQAPHVDAMGLSYGTALVSRLELSNPQAITFSPSLSLVPKGFVVSTVRWPGKEHTEIDIVSCHLDFMSRSVRKKQVDELITVLRARGNHLVIMGDLNAEWDEQDSAARYLSEQLELTAYQPENSKIVTFPALRERLDWILISSGIEFSSHEVIGTPVSDHRGIVASLRLSGTSRTTTAQR